jgi:hypothetical protein
MPKITKTTVYEFHELSDEAKDKARAWFREGAGDHDWHEFIYDDFEEVCRILGVTLKTYPVRLMGGGTRHKPRVYFTGFSSQGDGACFEASYGYENGAARRIRDYAPRDPALHRIADLLQDAQRRNFYQLRADTTHYGRYCDAHSMGITVERDSIHCQDITAGAADAVIEALRELADWLHRRLEREWKYIMSDACADEGIAANAYTFTESGQRFG